MREEAARPTTSTLPHFRAAEYVRMSTEHQQYSTLNQNAKIREYAERRGIEIVKTYADDGRSGLTIGGRQSLQQLIADVQTGVANFNLILVYDISRWGRFQDADESAYYEYICKRAGIQVAYCAEQFENDGSPVSTIVKGVKRAMAGEYSRELSVKVFAGQCRLIELGYRQGGPAGYGLRRTLIDQTGHHKAELKRGEHKSLQTDRVILTPGPDEEVAVVNQIYRWYIDDSLTEVEISLKLNESGLMPEPGRKWTRSSVHEVLTNEKYIGSNIFNRQSFKLKKLRVINEPDMWIRKDEAFDPVVPADLFYTAQGVMRARARRFSNDELIDRLRNLYQKRGYLSGVVIDEQEDMPPSSIYAYRFGSLLRAYQLVGFTPERDYTFLETNRALRRMHPQIVATTEQEIYALGGAVHRDPATDLLDINHEFTLSIVLARCRQRPNGKNFWKLEFDTSLMPDITVAVRLAQGNAAPLDYYLLPSLDFRLSRLNLAERNAIEVESYRFDNLDYLHGMAEQVRLRRAA